MIKLRRRVTVCPGCNNEGYDKIIRKKENFIIYLCESCNAIYSNISDNKIINKEIGPPTKLKFYEIPRFRIHRYVFYTSALWDISYLEDKLDLSKIKTCLDIGAQFGFLIRELTKRGITAVGLDSARYPGTVSKNMIYSFFDLNYDESAKYDLICLTHMIHYFSDSYSILYKCLKMLNDDGVLFITSNSPDSPLVQDFVLRREYGPLVYLSKKNYETFCFQNKLTLLDYSTFNSRLFLTNVSLKNKLKLLFRYVFYMSGKYASFVENPKGERNYLLIKKTKSGQERFNL